MVAVCVMRWKHQWLATNSRASKNLGGPRQDRICTLSTLGVVSTPTLLTGSWNLVGPSARALIEWSQGISGGAGSATFAVWLTLRA